MDSSTKEWISSKKARALQVGVGADLLITAGAIAACVLAPTSAPSVAMIAGAALTAIGAIVTMYQHRQGKIDEAAQVNPK